MKAGRCIESQFLKAYEYIELGEICNAKLALDEIVMEDPTYARAHFLLGWIYFHFMADFKRAEKHVKLCYRYDPSFAPNYSVYADILTVQDKLDELIKLSVDALSVPGIDRSYIFYKLAHAKEAVENYTEAIKFIDKSKKYSTSPEWMRFISKEKTRIHKKIGFFKQIAAFL